MTAIDKALDVMDALSRARHPMGLGEVVTACGLPKPTVRRLLVDLMRQSFVIQNEKNKYEVGNQVVDLAAQSLTRLTLAEVSANALARLQQQVTGTITVARFAGDTLTTVSHLDSTASSFVVAPTPSAPLYATASGKAVLAYLPLPDVERLVSGQIQPLTARTLASFEELEQDLAVSLARGFATEDEEARSGIRAVAAPIRTFVQRPVGAVAVAAPAQLVSMPELRRMAPYVVAAADEISLTLGGDPIIERRVQAS